MNEGIKKYSASFFHAVRKQIIMSIISRVVFFKILMGSREASSHWYTDITKDNRHNRIIIGIVRTWTGNCTCFRDLDLNWKFLTIIHVFSCQINEDLKMRMSHYLYQAPAKPAATQHGSEEHGGASNSGLWRGRDSRGILLPSISQGEREKSAEWAYCCC